MAREYERLFRHVEREPVDRFLEPFHGHRYSVLDELAIRRGMNGEG